MANGETGNGERVDDMEVGLDSGAEVRKVENEKSRFRKTVAGTLAVLGIGVGFGGKALSGDEKPVDPNAGKKNPPISEKSTTEKADTPAVSGELVAGADVDLEALMDEVLEEDTMGTQGRIAEENRKQKKADKEFASVVNAAVQEALKK